MNKKQRKKLQKFFPYLRAIVGVLTLLLLFFLALDAINQTNALENVEAAGGDVLGVADINLENTVTVLSPNGVEVELKQPDESEMAQAQEKYDEKLRKIEEERRRKEEEERQRRLQRIAPLENFLKKKASPMAPYAELILDSCEKYGDHYCKMFLSIAGVESGFGRVPIGCCNAWGLVGVYYPTWNASIPKACNQIANNYYLKGVNTLEKLAYSSYGPQNPEKWIQDLYYYYNQIPL